MDSNSVLVKAAGPAVIAAIAFGAIVTGAYSDKASSLSPDAPRPLPEQVRLGAIEVGPVAPGSQMAARQSGAIGAPSAGFGGPLASRMLGEEVETGATYSVATAPLQIDGYVRYLEVGAFAARSEADAKAAALSSVIADETRMGDVAVVFAPSALTRKYRVHIGPFAEDVTNEDVRIFKRLIGHPGAVIVSVVEAQTAGDAR